MINWISDEETLATTGRTIRDLSPGEIEAFICGREIGWAFDSAERIYDLFQRWIRSVNQSKKHLAVPMQIQFDDEQGGAP